MASSNQTERPAPSPTDIAESASLDNLYKHLESISIGPGWNKPTPSLWPAPKKNYSPHQWHYSHGRSALDAAGRLINTELAERRNLILANPTGDGYATARTIISAYQMIMPGEKARSHRHSPNALRLVLEAQTGCYTVVDGQKLPMMPGDVVLTPNWSWHGHGNEGSACGYWVDFLDVPLVQLLEPMFFEQHADGFESNAPLTAVSPCIFHWQETLQRLDIAEPTPKSPFGTEIALGNYATDTMALSMMRLASSCNTTPHRTTANNIYTVAKGSGRTFIEEQCFEWTHGDVIVAPAWHRHHHVASEESVLFRVTDFPVMDRLGFLRSEIFRYAS